MSSPYDYQVFVSYAREQRTTVEGFVAELRAAELTVWWDKDIPPGDAWRQSLEEKIKHCRHFLLYCNVQAKASDRVSQEMRLFLEDAKGDPSRKLFVLRAPDCQEKHVPPDVEHVQRVNSLSEVVVDILKEARHDLEQKFRELERRAENERKDLEENFAKERRKVAEARKYYKHRRFWGPFADKKDVHIFTCGRDIPPDDTRPRGSGGFRTNIDKWDYRAVLGITHYFASNYPGTKLTIEDPASKLQQEDINQIYVLANRIAEVGNLLKDKHCIIIGSPDVNDFAEIVLSKIHGIHAYDNNRKKSKGFVLVRDKKNSASAFYWETAEGEHEGIACLGPGDMRIYEHVPAPSTAGPSGTGSMHGILVVAENPFFSDSEPRRRIMILSGFSGVATNAMAKFLTEEAYLPSFFEFDEAQSQHAGAIEAVISVKYIVESGSENKDARQIPEAADSIAFQELVAV